MNVNCWRVNFNSGQRFGFTWCIPFTKTCFERWSIDEKKCLKVFVSKIKRFENLTRHFESYALRSRRECDQSRLQTRCKHYQPTAMPLATGILQIWTVLGHRLELENSQLVEKSSHMRNPLEGSKVLSRQHMLFEWQRLRMRKVYNSNVKLDSWLFFTWCKPWWNGNHCIIVCSCYWRCWWTALWLLK